METAPLCVGIDVAKGQLDIAIGSAGETWTLTNDEAGIERLVADLRGRSCGLVVLEATGGFEVPAVIATVEDRTCLTSDTVANASGICCTPIRAH